MKLWTFQKKEIWQNLQNHEIYLPDFRESSYFNNSEDFIAEENRNLYNFLLNSFNNVNGTNYTGLVFTFPGTTNETQDMIQGYDSLGDLLYQFSVHIDALLSLMRKFISPDYVLLEIDFTEGDRLNLIPIDMNDYQAIMPPICLTPEYNERTLGEICSAIESGLFFRSPFPSHIVQTVIPYIRREEVVHVYKAEEYEDFSDLLEIASCQFKRNQYIDPSLCLTFGAAICRESGCVSGNRPLL